MKTPYLIGVCGGSASGKTSFLSRLAREFTADELCIVSQDDYYKPLEEQVRDENGEVNYDLPGAVDSDLLLAHLQRLLAGEVIEIEEYTFNNPDIIPKQKTLRPSGVIIIEGLFIMHYEAIRRLTELKVFIDARADIRLQRRIRRDLAERGSDLETVVYQWTHHVYPAFQRYLEPYRDDADIIIKNNYSQDKAQQLVVDHLRAVLIGRSV